MKLKSENVNRIYGEIAEEMRIMKRFPQQHVLPSKRVLVFCMSIQKRNSSSQAYYLYEWYNTWEWQGKIKQLSQRQASVSSPVVTVATELLPARMQPECHRTPLPLKCCWIAPSPKCCWYLGFVGQIQPAGCKLLIPDIVGFIC